MKKMQVFIAGHGGQGVLELGNYIAYRGIMEGRHVACTPSYGPESRGGKVRCYVVVADGEIDSPITEEPDMLIVMNIPSMEFVDQLRPEGLLITNSSIIDTEPMRRDITVVRLPANDLAESLKSELPNDVLEGIKDIQIVSNSVVFGAYLALMGIAFSESEVNEILQHFFTDRKARYIPVNLAAVEKGYRYIKDHATRLR